MQTAEPGLRQLHRTYVPSILRVTANAHDSPLAPEEFQLPDTAPELSYRL